MKSKVSPESDPQMSAEAMEIIADTAADFLGAVDSLPEDHPARMQVEADSESLRRSNLAGAQALAVSQERY